MAKIPEARCTLKVRVQPKSSRNQIGGFENGTLRLRVTAPPTKGKANAGVIALVAKTLGVSKSRLDIIRDHGSRDTLTELEVRRRSEAVANPREGAEEERCRS